MKWGPDDRRYQRVDLDVRGVSRELGRIMTLKQNCREQVRCLEDLVRKGRFCVSSVTEHSLPYEFQVLLHSALG